MLKVLRDGRYHAIRRDPPKLSCRVRPGTAGVVAAGDWLHHQVIPWVRPSPLFVPGPDDRDDWPLSVAKRE